MKWFLLALFCGNFGAAAADTITALEAVALLPADKQKQVSVVEGREGAPDPVRWYVVAADPSEPNGLHEYVTSGGAIVASRSVSQFATRLAPQDALGIDAVKFDSSYAASIAKNYADAGKLKFSAMNYELRKGPDAIPRWTVSCLDDDGNALAEITLSASKGSVISHSGFPALPENTAKPPKRKKIVSVKRPVPSPAPVAELVPANPIPASTPRGTLFQKVGSSMGKLFGRKDQ